MPTLLTPPALEVILQGLTSRKSVAASRTSRQPAALLPGSTTAVRTAGLKLYAAEAALLRLVTIDLSQADLDVFERYEASVLTLLPKHRGRLELRVRALDGQTETHLLYFPDEQAFDAFRSDPARLVLADEWKRCGALSTAQLVERIAEG